MLPTNSLDTWMNNPVHKAAFGVSPDRTFVNVLFTSILQDSMKGDSMHNSAALPPELIDGGVR